MEQVIDKNPTNYYDLKAKAVLVVKNQQLLCTMSVTLQAGCKIV